MVTGPSGVTGEIAQCPVEEGRGGDSGHVPTLNPAIMEDRVSVWAQRLTPVMTRDVQVSRDFYGVP